MWFSGWTVSQTGQLPTSWLVSRAATRFTGTEDLFSPCWPVGATDTASRGPVTPEYLGPGIQFAFSWDKGYQSLLAPFDSRLCFRLKVLKGDCATRCSVSGTLKDKDRFHYPWTRSGRLMISATCLT